MPGDPRADEAIQLIDFWTPLLLRMCVTGGVMEAFGREPRSVAEVAAQTGLDADALRRVVRALESRGVFARSGDGAVWLTEVGRRFLSDEPGNVTGLANFKPWELHAWAEADHSLRTGEPSFPTHFGAEYWAWLEAHPEFSARFDEDMRQRTTTLIDRGLALYDWPEEGTLVDIGGGNGVLLERVLRERPGLRGVVFDQPHVVAAAAAYLEAAGVADRAEAVGGSFFEQVPPGDLYLMASVLHDWADDDAVRILETIRRAMKPASKLVLFESVLEPGDEPSHWKMVDLHMLVLFGARERTLEEWETLLGRGGFTLDREIPTPGLSWLECRPS